MTGETIYTVVLAHVSCPGLHAHSFLSKRNAQRCARDHVAAMYAERRKDGGYEGLMKGRITMYNWESFSDALDDWEGEDYLCVQWFQSKLEE